MEGERAMGADNHKLGKFDITGILPRIQLYSIGVDPGFPDTLSSTYFIYYFIFFYVQLYNR